MTFYAIYWNDAPNDILFLVEEGVSFRLHWVSHPFVVGQLISKNLDVVVAHTSPIQKFTGQQILNMVINVKDQTFSQIKS